MPGDRLEFEADRTATEIVSQDIHSSSADRFHAAHAASDVVQPWEPHHIDGLVGSPGEPLDPATRVRMEKRFGSDFREVRVHTGARAERAARVFSASAFTTGQHIYFGPGRFDPDTSDGQRLLAHELTHTIQQRTTAGTAQTRTATHEPVQVIQRQPSNPDTTTLDLIEERLWTEISKTSDDMDEAVSNNDALGAALYRRRQLLLANRPPIDFANELDVEQFIDLVDRQAEDEFLTLQELGYSVMWSAPEAFPDEWSKWVEKVLRIDGVNVNTLRDEFRADWNTALKIGETLPEYLFAHGLPVSYAESLQLSRFELQLVHVNASGKVGEFAIAARRAVASNAGFQFVRSWNAITANYVEEIRTGTKTVNPADYDHFRVATSESLKTIYPRMRSFIEQQTHDRAFGHELTPVNALEEDQWITSFGAGLLSITALFETWRMAKEWFEEYEVRANIRIAALGDWEKVQLASEWAYRNGWIASEAKQVALGMIEQVWHDLPEKALKKVGMYVVKRIVPGVGWVLLVTDVIGDIADVVCTASDLIDAIAAVRNAHGLVTLQHASANMVKETVGVAAKAAAKAATALATKGAKAAKGQSSAASGAAGRPPAGQRAVTSQPANAPGLPPSAAKTTHGQMGPAVPPIAPSRLPDAPRVLNVPPPSGTPMVSTTPQKAASTKITRGHETDVKPDAPTTASSKDKDRGPDRTLVPAAGAADRPPAGQHTVAPQPTNAPGLPASAAKTTHGQIGQAVPPVAPSPLPDVPRVTNLPLTDTPIISPTPQKAASIKTAHGQETDVKPDAPTTASRKKDKDRAPDRTLVTSKAEADDDPKGGRGGGKKSSLKNQSDPAKRSGKGSKEEKESEQAAGKLRSNPNIPVKVYPPLEVFTHTSQSGFRRRLTRFFDNNPNHPLISLYNKATGKLNPSTQAGMDEFYWEEHPEAAQAGHVRSRHTGARDQIVIMTAAENQLYSRSIEGKGGSIRGGFEVAIIEGLPISVTSAKHMISYGKLDPKALENALIVDVDDL